MAKPTYEELEQRVKEVETARREKEKALGELDDRVKKLNCLYGLSRLEEKTGEILEQLLQETVSLIPSSWQYPGITCAKVSVGEKQYTSGQFEETPWKQSADINVHGEVVGIVEIYYLEEKPPLDEGPFSKEERLLLDVIAERLGRIIERRQAGEALDHEFAVDEALSELYKPLISASATMEEISSKILDQALQLTGSAHGYVSSIDADTGDNICHTFTEMLKGRCDVVEGERRIVFPFGTDGRYNGLCGQCLNTRESFFTNTATPRPSSGEMPEGHISLERFLSVPVILGDELVGQIALANKVDGYTSRDIEAVNRLAEYYALAIRRMRDREALQESEMRFRFTFEQAAVGISHVAPDGRFLRINRRFCDIVGYTHEEMLNRTFQAITHPDDLETDVGYVERMLKGEIENYSMEKRYLRKDGSVVWVNLTVSLVWDEVGKPLHFISAVEDISRRKQMEAYLKEAYDDLERQGEERFRAIADYTHDWETWVNPGGKLIWTNPAVERITGYSLEEYMSHSDRMSMLIAGENRDEIIKARKEALEKQLSGNDIPFRILRKDGSERWVSISYQPIYAADGKYLGLRSSIRDISDRKQAEEEHKKLTEQLREAQKAEAVGTLAGGIAHDFNNILSVIVGYTQLAQDVLAPDSEAGPMLGSIIKASDRARDLIQQILAFSWDSSQERKPMQIPPVIDEVVKLLNATIPKSIVILRDIDPDCGTILGDSSQIHQVLMNLCTNAYHAMRENGGTLTVSLKSVDIPAESDKTGDMEPGPGAYVRLKIGDSGKGMNQTVLERVFDPYFTTKKKGEGTGLGLAVAQGIVKSHNGFISVSSTPGVGTTFYIYLPRLDVGSGVSKAASEEPLPGGDERILFVDDEEHLVHIWSKVLERLGYHVTSTTSSVEALEMFRKNPGGFDLLITDMNMPLLTGAQLTRSILEIRTDIPVILCTGYSEMIDESEAGNIGFRKYVMKPVLREDFARAVRKVLDEEK